MKYLSLILFLLFLENHAFPQEQPSPQKPEKDFDRVITYTQLWQEIIACEDSIYRLDNVLVKFHRIYAEEVEELCRKKRVIKPYILFDDAEFRNVFIDWASESKEDINLNEYYEDIVIYLKNITFERMVKFNGLKGVKIVFFKNCILKDGLAIHGNKEIYQISIENCKIDRTFIINVAQSELSYGSLIIVKNSSIHLKHKALGKRRWSSGKGHFIGSSLTSLILENSIFTSDTILNSINVKNRTEQGFKQLIIDSCIFETNLVLNRSRISKKIDVKDTKFKNISLKNVTFPPENNVNLKWFQLANHISIIEWVSGHKINYQAITDEELKDIYKYDELIAIYNKLFQIYKARGDIESVNGCYVELKDVETRRLNYLYRQAPSIKTYFDWKINHFLKFFCDYGTSPAKSLVISFYVVLIFAAFYFFFYSDWDKINRSFLIRKYMNMLKYFRSEQKLEDFYTEKHKDEFRSYENFRKELEESKVEIPFFFNLLGKPLYHLSLIKHQVMSWLYRRTDILSGKWTDLQPARKVIVGTTVSLVILVYLINLVFIRSLNSIFLSINTFSTLGFGDIPVKGISRYMAILEGFLGWFLLSIFSVSLISQILKI